MIDRTDLQLMLCEQIMEMDTDNLVELANQLTEHGVESTDDPEIITGLESIQLMTPENFKKWLGFLLYVLGERVQIARI